jgi:hypothetical protein
VFPRSRRSDLEIRAPYAVQWRMLEQLAGVVGDLAVGQYQLTEWVSGLEQGQAVILEQLQQHGRILPRLDLGEPEA